MYGRDAWDMAAEICLSQLPTLVEDPNAEFQPSPFFTEQLTAFEVWLDHGSKDKKPPEQLPIVLQVLLSQCHRFRALVLLGRFLDMGPWAVDLALSVGIFPYVLKLLQTTTPELRQILVFIWTKILALDKVHDLVVTQHLCCLIFHFCVFHLCLFFLI
ncbi:regulatory-associated protein of TOR 1-like [Capsicum annuum]|uniref:regulatory-associated protein of TOR 1-like n=1 Tax=Capsicum annuum TaxID=4072 RepID=UPI001FB0B821|nr:regulatory-associated protein of TOR 1-like [Capsicum annuum]